MSYLATNTNGVAYAKSKSSSGGGSTSKGGKSGKCVDSALDEWDIVVNNNDTIPLATNGSIDPEETFASYNSASINTQKFVVFRARSTGGGEPETGVFVRDMVDPSTSDIVRQGNCLYFYPHIYYNTVYIYRQIYTVFIVNTY